MPDAETTDFHLTKEALTQAAALALSFHGRKPRSWHKPDGTVVTEADIAIDDLLRGLITTARPDDGWLSEETPDTSARLSRKRLWIVDPIDGTRDFLAGGANWCIGVALTENGAPVLSAVMCPVQNMFYHGSVGKGSYRNGARLLVRESSGNPIVLAPRACVTGLRAIGTSPQSGSALPLLLRLVAVAENNAAGAISLGPKNDWDIAAGHLILTEAGGVVSNTAGTEMIYNKPQPWQPGLLAATAKWHRPISEILRHM